MGSRTLRRRVAFANVLKHLPQAKIAVSWGVFTSEPSISKGFLPEDSGFTPLKLSDLPGFLKDFIDLFFNHHLGLNLSNTFLPLDLYTITLGYSTLLVSPQKDPTIFVRSALSMLEKKSKVMSSLHHFSSFALYRKPQPALMPP